MKQFMDRDFLLETDTAKKLFHHTAAELPICDFHCHIPARQIAENQPFSSITQVWLGRPATGGDHYKWRAMRIAGVDENQITGSLSEKERFFAWAETAPKLIGNPLYHWTHLELQRYFQISEPLSPQTAEAIWTECNRQITSLRPQDLIRISNVKLVCTTDDPVDSLCWHQALRGNDSGAVILPAWRPDKALNINTDTFGPWLLRLENAAGFSIKDFDALKRALRLRLEFFHQNGCRLSDHALDTVPAGEPVESMAQEAFIMSRRGEVAPPHLADIYRTALLVFLASEYSRLRWTMQLHIGAMRNVNPEQFQKLGPDTGYDAIGDAPVARPLSSLLGMMSRNAPLPRTLLFTLNDKDNYTLGALSGALQRSGAPAHVYQGPGWWFHDQKDGMEKQMRSLANVGLLSEFIGMTTDSRSLLSYTRHEYFRRIFCNMLGQWVEKGEYPPDYAMLETIIRKVCYENAMRLFSDVTGFTR